MSDRTDQLGSAAWRGAAAQSSVLGGNMPSTPTRREMRYEERGQAKGFRRGTAFGIVLGFTGGFVAALFVVAVYRAVMAVIGPAT